jgi:hypothetical protein
VLRIFKFVEDVLDGTIDVLVEPLTDQTCLPYSAAFALSLEPAALHLPGHGSVPRYAQLCRSGKNRDRHIMRLVAHKYFVSQTMGSMTCMASYGRHAKSSHLFLL